MEKSIAKVKAPKGFSFKIQKLSNYYYRVWLLEGPTKKQIGRVTLVKDKHNVSETHSWLDEKFHNKGLGALLYARAIQYGLEKGWKVRSSGSSSDMAQRVWKGKLIRQYFSIRYRKNKDNPRHDKWYAYAK